MIEVVHVQHTPHIAARHSAKASDIASGINAEEDLAYPGYRIMDNGNVGWQACRTFQSEDKCSDADLKREAGWAVD